MTENLTCPNCGGENLYQGPQVNAGGGYAPILIPGLGGFLIPPKFQPVVCEDCGLTRFFASQEARSKISQSRKWFKLCKRNESHQ